MTTEIGPVVSRVFTAQRWVERTMGAMGRRTPSGQRGRKARLRHRARNLRLPTGANIGRPATSGLGRRARVETQRTGAPRTRPPGPGDTTHPLV